MKRAIVRALAVALLLTAASACSRSADSVVPNVMGDPSARTHRHVLARLNVKVPPCRKGDRGCRRHGRDRYVSPATQSLGYTIDGGTQTNVSISTGNPDCKLVGAIGYLECTATISTSPGTHAFSFTAYAGANGTGKVLSANTDVSYDVKTGAANQIPVILGGVAASLSVFPPNVPQVTGNQYGGFTIYGVGALNFSIVPVDADGNFIVGPGAPQPVVANAPNDMTMRTSAGSPNTWTFTSTYAPADPAIAASSSIAVSATPVPNSGGSTVTATVPLSLYVPWLYTVSNNGGTSAYMTVTDEAGNPVTLSGFSGLGNPAVPAYDPQTGWIYVTDFSNNAIHVYDRLGNPETPTAGSPFSGLSTPIGIAYDSHNGYLYVVNSGNDTMSYFDGEGNTIGTFPIEAATPQRVAFDSANDQLYVTEYGNNSIFAYTESGSNVALQSLENTETGPTGIAYDSHDNLLYVCNHGSASGVQAFNPDGTAHGGAFTITASLSDLAYDPHNGLLYTSSYLANSVFGFNESGTTIVSIEPISININTPYGMVVVP